MKIIHTADNHLGMPLTSLPLEKAIIRSEERLAAFSKIIDYTISSKGDMLIISGDLFDSPTPDDKLISYCRSLFQKLGNTPVFLALGNHDYALKENLFPGNVHIFPNSPHCFTADNLCVTGVSFNSPSEAFLSTLPPARDKSRINILCIHGDLFSKSEYNPLDKAFLSSLGYDYIALGHIHQSYIAPPFCYPGCHDGSGFDEEGVKGFIECDINKPSVDIKFIPSSSRIYETICIDISPFSSSEEIVSAIESCLGDGLYKIILQGEVKEGFSPNIEYISKELSSKVFYVKVYDETSLSSDISETALFRLFNEYIQENFDEETARLAIKYGTKALKGEDVYEI